MESISKAELISNISKKTELSKKEVQSVVDEYVNEVIDAVSDGKKVQFVGFGTFEPRDRAARKGRNPQTGEPITIPASTVPAFKAGKAFKDAVNK